MSINPKIAGIQDKKRREKITMLTCYDVSFARALDEMDIDILLVGDSLANVVLGMESTRQVGFREMYAHTKAVAGAVKQTAVVADMPYVTYQRKGSDAVRYACRFVDEARADAVKIEWFPRAAEVARSLVRKGVALMGHVGLTPQTADKLGGFRVQGRDSRRAAELYRQAREFEDAGAFSVVIECVPSKIAQLLTRKLTIPTIGIGAGKYCDGQVLVLYDMLGLYKKIRPKFVKEYADMYSAVKRAAGAYIREVREGKFPSEAESFHISAGEWEAFTALLSRPDNDIGLRR